MIEPQLRGEPVALPDLTLAEFARRLPRAPRRRRPGAHDQRCCATGSGTPRRVYGDVPLRELERMSGELAGWRAKLPERSTLAIMAALRQTLGAAVALGLHEPRTRRRRPDSNPQPPPRPVRPYTVRRAGRDRRRALGRVPSPCPTSPPPPGYAPRNGWRSSAATWTARAGLLHVRRTVSSGEVVELGKTSRSRRQVPLSRRALAALDRLPPRLDPPLLFSAPEGGLLNLDNFRRREWAPGDRGRPAIATPGADLRPALDVRVAMRSRPGVTVFELARIMGSSVRMIERHYGALLDGAGAGISGRLDALEAQLEQGARAEASD